MMASEDEKYEVLEKIGHGSFGVIRKVRRKSDGYVLCRKEISYLKMSTKEREQLQAELNILKELRHPNIVQYFERVHHKQSSDLYLYMEYCGNGDLGRVIKNLKLKNQYAEEEFVWSMLSQLVTALYRCHEGRDPPEVGKNVMGNLGAEAKSELRSKKNAPYIVLHRDLKPENVFLGADNSVKLGDFGLSKIIASHDFASTYVGTPFYMSPEICKAERYTHFSDIWALGCIIYELCTKEPPFNAKTHFELIQKIQLGKYKEIPSVYSPELRNVIAICLRPNPNHRPDTAQLLNLPIVKLMRKEQEVVALGHQLKAEKDLATKQLKDAQGAVASLETQKQEIRIDIEAQVRREWEVKARLEIDRQVQAEMKRLQNAFEEEVSRRVAEGILAYQTQHQAQQQLQQQQQQQAAVPPAINTQRPPPDYSIRSSTPTIDEDDDIPTLPKASFSTLAEESEFPSQTDLCTLSIDEQDSPSLVRKSAIPAYMKPKRAARTPLTRAKTMFAAPRDSPMDIVMASPSPIQIASLSLSPRRDAAATANAQQTQNSSSMFPRGNIFAQAAGHFPPPTQTHKKSIFGPADEIDEDLVLAALNEGIPIPSSPSLSSPDRERPASAPETNGNEDEEEGSLALPALPSPTRSGDPFKVLHPQQRPGPGPLATAPRAKATGAAGKVTAGRLASAPGWVGGGSAKDLPSSARPHSRGAGPTQVRSTVPVVATSPTRPRSSKFLGGLAAQTSPARKTANSDLRGRTLVELAQARGAPGDGSSILSNGNGKGGAKAAANPANAIALSTKLALPAEWDPERDEMPSPFLVRSKAIGQRLMGMGRLS